MSETTSSFFDNLSAAARENPLATALIGAGALWLISGASAFSTVSFAARQASAGATVAAEKVKGSVDSLKEAGSAQLDNISSRISDATASLTPDPGKIADFQAHAVSSLTDLLERQPLAIGLLGSIVGGLIASAIPSTARERDLMGDASAEARSELRTRLEAVKPIVQSGAAELTRQARAAASDLATEAQRTGQDALQAGAKSLKADPGNRG